MKMDNFLEIDEAECLRRNNYTKEKLNSDVELLKRWVQMQPHLPKIEDQKLRMMIIRAKFSLEKSKRRVDAYCAFKSLSPEVTEKFDPLLPDNETLFKYAMAFPLKKVTPNLERIYIFQYPSDGKCVVLNLIATMLMIEEFRLLHDPHGVQFIYDLEHLNVNIITQMNPVLIKKLSDLLMTGYGCKFSGLHILNGNFLDFIMALTKQILKPKIFARIKVHKSLESLHEHIPKSILPAEYGGTESNCDEIREVWRKYCLENRDYFLRMADLKSDESKRPEDQKDQFGSLHGTFRKLEVD